MWRFLEPNGFLNVSATTDRTRQGWTFGPVDQMKLESRGLLSESGKEGRVTLDGKSLKASVKPKVDPVIIVDVPEADPIDVIRQNIAISLSTKIWI